MTSFAHDERLALADLMLELGPDAPTLCAGWTTRDLAAHLVVRERRPDAAVGIVVGPLAGWTAKVQADAAERPYADLVDDVRSGPPLWSAFRLPGADELGNLFEYVVHHEDVRRAEPGWQPRDVDPALADLLWSRLGRSARMLLRGSGGGVVLQRTGGSAPGDEVVVRSGDPTVTVSGDVVELVMHVYGRTEARVELAGDPGAVAEYAAARRGV